MIYPGNPSLSQEVQQRALQTFQQSLDLAAAGRDQEALAGCDFILGLDGLFRPARILQERVKSPVRPVVVDDLRAKIEEAPAADDAAELPELEPLEGADLGALEIEELESPAAPPEAPAAPAAPAAPQGGLGVVLFDLLQKKNYQQVLQIAASQKAAIEQNPELGAMVKKAQAALAAAPPEPDPGAAANELEAIPLDEPATPPPPPATPPPPPEEVSPADEPVLSFDEPDDEPIGVAPEPPAEAEEDEDDLLDLQAQSLSIDSADESSDLDFGSDLDSDLGSSLDDDLDGGLGLDDDLDLDSADLDSADLDSADLDSADLDSVDLDEDELPDLDVGASAGPDDATPARVPGSGDEFDLAAGAEEPDSEGRERISELLDEGQEIFESGDYQGAIDVWSRIFLIDVTHGEASQRIEEARRKKAELERQAEEIFHQGVDHIEEQNLGQAKESFRQVLEIDAEHSLAREYLEQLEAGEVPVIKRRASESVEDEDFESDLGDLEGEDSQSMDAAVQRDRVVVVKRTDKKLVALGAIVALAVIGGGAYLFLNKDKLFPNAETVAPSVPRVDPIARATALYERGDAEEAIAALRQVATEDPSYDKALALIGKWEAELEAENEIDAGPSPELLARRNRILVAARQAHDTGQCIRATRFFASAHKILPLDAADQALENECSVQLEDLAEELRLFGEREYAAILPGLWLKREERPDDPDLELLIIDSYYNLALGDLQRGDPTAAASKLEEALTVDPDNSDLQRLHLFAETYSGRSRDMLYTIFVKYLPSR